VKNERALRDARCRLYRECESRQYREGNPSSMLGGIAWLESAYARVPRRDVSVETGIVTGSKKRSAEIEPWLRNCILPASR